MINRSWLAGALTVMAWLLGTFIDALRNLIVEDIWDRIPNQKVNWRFFVHGETTKVTNCEKYFFSFYMIDVDLAVAIILFLLVGPLVLRIITSQAVPAYSLAKHVLLMVVALVFGLDAFSLRKEIRDYIGKDAPF